MVKAYLYEFVFNKLVSLQRYRSSTHREQVLVCLQMYGSFKVPCAKFRHIADNCHTALGVVAYHVKGYLSDASRLVSVHYLRRKLRRKLLR